MTIKYPVYRPRLTGREKEFVVECLDSTWISSKGKYISQFETLFAGYVGARHGAATSNGTVALHLALAALGIGPGDEVIVPTLTYIASANAVAYTGATPVFIDSEPNYWQLDPARIEELITPRTRAIMPVHLYGHPCDMRAVMSIAEKHGLKVVEDCAEAIGTTDHGRMVGSFGDIASFSFFGNKTITTGEGGMVLSNDDEIADLVVRLRGQGLAKGREYWHDIVGFNYRMTNICAAIGCAQMETIDQALADKRRVADWYRRGLVGLPLTVHGCRSGAVNTYWMVSALVDDPGDRDALRTSLRAAGIETRPLFPPIHTMDMYRRPDDQFPVALSLSSRGLNLPSYPDLREQDVAEICGIVGEHFAGRIR